MRLPSCILQAADPRLPGMRWTGPGLVGTTRAVAPALPVARVYGTTYRRRAGIDQRMILRSTDDTSHHPGCRICRKTSRWLILASASNSNTLSEFTTCTVSL